MDYSAIGPGGFGDDDQRPASSPRPNDSFSQPSFDTTPSSPPFSPPRHTVDNPPESPEALSSGQKFPTNNQNQRESNPAAAPPPQQPQFRPEPQQRSSSRQVLTHPKKPHVQYKLQAKITGLERSGRKDPVLRFDVHTNLPKFRTTQFRDVRRTHPEFVKLAAHLISANPECFVPSVPPPSTSAGVGTDEDEARVRGSMQRWLNYVCGDETLIRDEEMVYFVESDFGYSPVVRRKQPATGVRRKMLKQLAPPHDDTDLAEARPIVKAFYLGTMEGGQKVDKVVKARRGLALAENDLGVKMTQLSDPALTAHPGLSLALRKLGKTIQSVGDQRAVQATAEATTLSDAFQYHSDDAFIVKETLTNRQMLMRDLVSAQTSTRSKLSTTDRLKSSSNIRKDKVDEAISALDEARSYETQLQAKVNRVTSNLLVEQRKWFSRTAGDLRASVREFTLRQIEAERRVLATLESVRPDIRNIDASGGLSRLGRDVPPQRRANLAVSQGPKGDAWSGGARSHAPDINRNSVVGSMVITPAIGGKSNGKITEEEEDGDGKDRLSKSGVLGDGDGEDDRVDARNAASRLAASTF